jgi:hypothetical protein
MATVHDFLQPFASRVFGDGTLLHTMTSLGSPLAELYNNFNGGYFWGRALLIRPVEWAESEPLTVSCWNRPDLWKDGYADVVANCTFFAEDVFGVQFGVLASDIVQFDPETATLTLLARSIGLPIPRHRRSVTAAYLRVWVTIAACLSLVAMLESPFLVIIPYTMALMAGYCWFFVGKLSASEIRKRLAYGLWLESPIDPAVLGPDWSAPSLGALRIFLNEREFVVGWQWGARPRQSLMQSMRSDCKPCAAYSVEHAGLLAMNPH